ncbi:hypothetical protein PMAYCL1PPCAC_04089 [Pristionchus mayeri]|uniref:FAD-dependent oxidoreductase domain-containing protein 1 n=1 Tax=Pristionchus mayeri TaxID=1317129 RepID=A0AAN4Z5V9_9BILA|nr:hypothetical protein PMAYCL1PPCAC_04089 [Pristionchus mayeri]
MALAQQRLLRLASVASSSTRTLHFSAIRAWQGFENERHYEPGEDVLKRTWHGLTYDFRRWKRRYQEARNDAFKRRHPIAHMKHSVMDHEVWPYRAEVLILGGGLTGSSTAFWLKERFRDEDFKVVVVECNDKFPSSSTMLSTGSLAQQFSQPENCEMSQFTAEFMRHTGKHLRVLDSEPPSLNFLPSGFLHLATTEEAANEMREHWKLQLNKGARVSLLSPVQLREQYPFLNVDDVVLASIGLENEGTIDTWQLLGAIREKNLTLGVQYIKGEVEGFEFERSPTSPEVHSLIDDAEEADEDKWRKQRVIGVHVRPQMTDASARPIRAHKIVNATGAYAGKIARMAGIGSALNGMLSVPIPIEGRKRTRFVIHAPDVPVDMPFLVDMEGRLHCRQIDTGHTYVVDLTPTPEEDKTINHEDPSVDYDVFYEKIWPQLVKRVEGFSTAKIKSAYTVLEDVNTFDSVPVIGEHPLYTNIHTMAGFGERSAMHSVAAARAYAERLYDGAYHTINLRRFDMRRIVKNDPIIEKYRY